MSVIHYNHIFIIDLDGRSLTGIACKQGKVGTHSTYDRASVTCKNCKKTYIFRNVPSSKTTRRQMVGECVLHLKGCTGKIEPPSINACLHCLVRKRELQRRRNKHKRRYNSISYQHEST